MNKLSEKLVAHRGESFEAPENSLTAINMAWRKGAMAVEVDVHLSLDNEIVVIHDKHTGRVGDKKLFIAKSKLHELRSVDIGIKKSIAFKGESIPTLKEVLESVPSEAKLLIEIKCGKNIISPLLQLLDSSKLKNAQIEIISFNLAILATIKKHAPQYKVLYLLNLDYSWPHWILRIHPPKIIKIILTNGLDGVNVWSGKIISRAFVKAFKSVGLLVYVWTVNDLPEAQRVFAYGVDALTTDRAAWLKKQLLGIKQ